MMLRGLLATRTLLLSSVCLRSSHRSISACANQVNNPNNDAFWKSRGLASRPDNWESKAAQRAVDGRLQARSNNAASRTSGERALAGRRTDIVVRAVKASLGGKAEVRKAGSQAKRTDIADSDYDLWVDVGDECLSRAERKVLRDTLTSMLNKGGDPARVVLKESTVRVLLNDEEHIDIAFSSYCFSCKQHHKPVQRFTNNPKARDAVRLIKAGSPQKFKGEAIEMAVLTAQGQKKGQSFGAVALAAFRLLAHRSQMEEFRAWLSDGEKYEYDAADDNYDDDDVDDDDDDDWFEEQARLDDEWYEDRLREDEEEEERKKERETRGPGH